MAKYNVSIVQTAHNVQGKTRKQYSSEEKIRIVLEGLRKESTMGELSRCEGIAHSLYCKWFREFLEAGKQRLAGNTKRQADGQGGLALVGLFAMLPWVLWGWWGRGNSSDSLTVGRVIES